MNQCESGVLANIPHITECESLMWLVASTYLIEILILLLFLQIFPKPPVTQPGVSMANTGEEFL